MTTNNIMDKTRHDLSSFHNTERGAEESFVEHPHYFEAGKRTQKSMVTHTVNDPDVTEDGAFALAMKGSGWNKSDN